MDMKYRTPVIIIGERGSLRNPKLSNLEVLARVLYQEPIYLSLEREIESIVDSKISKIALGRSLTNGEIGCALAHRAATLRAASVFQANQTFSAVSDWVLILEDDAEGDPDVFEKILLLLDDFRLDKPGLINFHKPLNSISPHANRDQFRNIGLQPKISKQCYWRGITSSYAVNWSASKLLKGLGSEKVAYVADWPPTYYPIQFLKSTFYLHQLSQVSVIGDRPSHTRRERLALHLTQILHLRTLTEHFGVSKTAIIKTLVINPILRDVLGKFHLNS